MRYHLEVGQGADIFRRQVFKKIGDQFDNCQTIENKAIYLNCFLPSFLIIITDC